MAITGKLWVRLRELEEERQGRVRQAILWAVPIILVALFIGKMLPGYDNFWHVLVPLLIAMVVAALVYGYLLGKVTRHYKEQVMPILLEEICPSLSYISEGCIDEDEFNDAGLFRAPDRYNGKDLIAGALGKTGIKFSLIHAEQENVQDSTDSEGRTTTQTAYETIFQGLFFVADFNKSFAGRTLVKPHSLDLFNRLFGAAVTLEDPDFNRMFSVNTTDQVEARYILTPSLMEKLKALHAKFGGFHASFCQGQLYLALAAPQDFFEPRMGQSLADAEQLQKIVAHLRLITGIVEDLGLNVRVWGEKAVG